MPTVLLGNPAAIDTNGGRSVGEQVTVRIMPETGWTHDEHMRDLTHHREGVWIAIADQPPSWVASDDDSLAQAIATHYGCPVISIYDARDKFLDKHPHAALVAHVGAPLADETEKG